MRNRLSCVGLFFFWAAFAVGCFLYRATHANAAEPLGTLASNEAGTVALRVVAPVAMGGLDVKSRTVEAGVFAGGLGLGLDLTLSGFVVTPAVAVAAKAATDGAPSYANIAAIVGLARYFWAGAMWHVGQDASRWYLLAGFDPLAVVGGLARGGP